MPSSPDSTTIKVVRSPNITRSFGIGFAFNDSLISLISKNMFAGKIFIKDFLDELEMQDIDVDKQEAEKISEFSDSLGQVSQN